MICACKTDASSPPPDLLDSLLLLSVPRRMDPSSVHQVVLLCSGSSQPLDWSRELASFRFRGFTRLSLCSRPTTQDVLHSRHYTAQLKIQLVRWPSRSTTSRSFSRQSLEWTSETTLVSPFMPIIRCWTDLTEPLLIFTATYAGPYIQKNVRQTPSAVSFSSLL